MVSNTGPARLDELLDMRLDLAVDIRQEEELLVALDHESGEMHGTEVVLRFREIGHQRGQLFGSALALAGALIGKSITR